MKMIYVDIMKGAQRQWKEKNILVKNKISEIDRAVLTVFNGFYPKLDDSLKSISNHFRNIDKS